jgi:ubiquinone/menaquinone biosynthesis C-methylase UbiE
MYQGFASVYDFLMTDTPYDQWYKLLKDTLLKYEFKGKQVLDLACGTGAMTHRLSKDGFDVMGVDTSNKMLEQAHTKGLEQNLKCKYIQQDIRSLDLFQPYDLIVSFCDGFNYLLSEEDLSMAFSSVATYLKKDGLFIMDLSSEYKLSQVLSNETYTEVHEDIVYIWDNHYDASTKLLEFDLTLFVEDEEGYQRFDEYHQQKAHELVTIERLMKDNHLEILEVLDTNTGLEIKEDSERWLIIGRRKNG